MAGFLGRLLGSNEATTQAIETVSSGLDKLFYTKQEQAQDNAQSISEGRAMLVDWIKTTQGSNLARRLIALTVTFTWVLQYIGSVICRIAAIWSDNPERLVESSSFLWESANSMSGETTLVLAYYFAAPYIGQIVGSVMDRILNKVKPT